jgi:hypothetical protein
MANNLQIFGCIHGWSTIIGTMTPICSISWVLKQELSKMNIMLNNEKGYVFLGYQPINVVIIKSTEFFLNVIIENINQKKL